MSNRVGYTMTEGQLAEAAFDSVWHFECPNCGSECIAEPDADRIVCQDCEIQVIIDNPWF